jgi:alcohol dehydrogenase, propanol-preferring
MATADTAKSYDIPQKHKACVYDKPGAISTKIVELDTPEPGAGEVLIRLTHSGVCHSDLGVMENRYGPLRHIPSLRLAYEHSWAVLPYPTQPGQIGGHEGVGHVVKLGPGADKGNIKLGDRVGIKVCNHICKKKC